MMNCKGYGRSRLRLFRYNVACRLKAGISESERGFIARQRPGNHVSYKTEVTQNRTVNPSVGILSSFKRKVSGYLGPVSARDARVHSVMATQQSAQHLK